MFRAIWNFLFPPAPTMSASPTYYKMLNLHFEEANRHCRPYTE